MSKPYITIQIPNLVQLQSAFQKAPGAMKAGLPNAINRALLLVGGKAAQNAPVRTGNLRSSILDPNRGLQLATPSVFYGYVGSGTNYGLFVEMGTRFMAARPYLKPAVESSEDEIKEIFTEAVSKALHNTIGRVK